ncbi:hypothetical protein HOR18_gp184 [Staphylococcus phage vB_SscM-1]|uniref:Uncharacterized protein n=2 Tax=Sciuriunavirus SscM1 TaxID=2734053 RepID=A0A1X9I9P4_9CAUD|nr:hypothetical protein HOR18_gp184 [Staphylococcus phage vB_SscM-1]ANT44847.1 hypothetical protein vB_SscM-1_183 [Staphylococcus phage vB_SscM-1]ANT45049.1 hypothetical protein vB_SscM-2_182 [Staphylococcus phage vB_SscM-2]
MDYTTYLDLFDVMEEEKEMWVGEYHLRFLRKVTSISIRISKRINGDGLLKKVTELYPEYYCYNITEIEKYDTLTEYLKDLEHIKEQVEKEKRERNEAVYKFLQ